jgi:hypothetical protein
MQGVLAAALPQLLREELDAAPGRWRHAVYVGMGSSVALAVAMALQVDTFFAPLIAFQALQPHTLSSWNRMLRCIWISGVAVILTVVFGSVLLQVPWLLLPCFFLTVSAVIYTIPLSSKLLEVLGILPPVARMLYEGVFHPGAIGAIGLQMWSGYTIGVVTATGFAYLLSPEHPRDELAASLSDCFARTRARLRRAGERFRDLDRTPGQPSAPPLSALPARLQLLDRARQDGIRRDDERALMALITTAERVEAGAEIADAMAQQPVGTVYRRQVDAEVGAVLAALDAALDRAARIVRGFGWRRGGDDDWPDVLGAVTALENRQLALRRAGAFATTSVAEAAQVNGFIAQLRSLAHALRISPATLERLAAGDVGKPGVEQARGTTLRFDAYAARFALKCGLATTLALLIPIAAGVDALFSLVVAPFLVAQTSYGATIEKAPLRLLGAVIGGVLGLATMMTLMVNTNEIAVWLVGFFLVVTGCAYFALGGPRVSYTLLQVAVTYMFVTVAAGPVSDVELALWRAFGTFVGAVVIVTTFRVVAPDYAGRQLIARLNDLLGDVVALLPSPAAGPLPIPRALALHRSIGYGVADLLRLVAEARLEGAQAGIDPTAAVEAAGLAQRIAYRAVAICRGRSLAALPPLPPAVHAAVADLLAAVHSHLELLRRVLTARHTMARPGSQAYRRACRSAADVAVCPRPELDTRLRTLVEQLDAVRFRELADWPANATGALFAELQHMQRIVDLLPALDAQLVAMCVLAVPQEGVAGGA